MSQISIGDWKATGDFFSRRGHRIFWRTEGRSDAPVLLLIHGFPTASWDWEAMWPELAKRYRLLTLDMIGFGFSDKPTTYDYSILDQANIYETLLHLRGVSEYHVLAHDYADTVAQELLARQHYRCCDRREVLVGECYTHLGEHDRITIMLMLKQGCSCGANRPTTATRAKHDRPRNCPAWRHAGGG